MKRNIFQKIKKMLPLCAVAVLAGNVACTGDFEKINTNPNGLRPEQIGVAARFNQPITSIYLNYQNRHYEYQLMQNLNADLYSGYMAVPTAFGGNYCNSTYAMNEGWNEMPFTAGESYVMKPISEILKSTEEPDFVSIAKIIRVEAMHRIVDIYGPIPYTQAMQGGSSVPYDDVETLYKTFIQELNESVDALTTFVDAGNADAARISEFDIVCGADHTQWIRFANTLRLRLAMRISMVAPELAKTTAEAAVKHKYGVLVAGNNNVEVKSASVQNPLSEINYGYNDIRVGASLISLLKGYDDPRLPVYVTPVGWYNDKDIADKKGKPTNKIGEYVGIRQGTFIDDKANYEMYSTINMIKASKNTDLTNPGQITNALPWMKVAEAYFLRAEGALRGWDMGGSAQDLYEQGIKVSFDEHGLSADAYNAYISNDKGVAADFEDPHDPVNNIAGIDKCTVKWNPAASNEEKLHKIINQKWIAMFPEGQEAWSEFRRTGYPKLFPVANNYSSTVNGGIENGQFVKRLRFPRNDKNANKAEVDKAVSLLSGPDNEATRLWWDTGRNF